MYLDRQLIRQVDAYAKGESTNRTQAFSSLVRLGLMADLEGVENEVEKEKKLKEALNKITSKLALNAYSNDVITSLLLLQAVGMDVIRPEKRPDYFFEAKRFVAEDLKKLKAQKNG